MALLRRNPRLRWALVILVTAGIGIAAGGIAAAVTRSSPSSAWATPSLRDRLGLVDVTARTAPAISLVDQRGRRVSLASLRGKIVVVDFMDPKCTDICPIVSQEYLRAAKLLGPDAARVEFVAVNVNQFHRGVADVAAFSREHRLSTLANWHFLTGATAQLRQVWKAYSVAVIPNPDGDVVHTSIMYFVDRSGKLRYAAMPTKDSASIPAWGRGIATVARGLGA
ncbi:MAG: SCO family protein [Gaiellaceae bacterium]